jgi:hypothetical protein
LPAPAPEDTVHSPVCAPGKLEILWTENGTVISRVMFYSLIYCIWRQNEKVEMKDVLLKTSC